MPRTAIKYTQWSLSTFPSLMELDTKGFSPFCYWIQRPNGLFWSFADRDVNSPIFLSPMGDEKNSHLNLTVRESTMTTKESLFSQPTKKINMACCTLIRRGINLIRTIEKLITHLIITSY